ncbi:hypothetical protein GGR21_002830 [Dysgonomonas hofstadii]|uniref:Uncharacterized protein n=1 Tax=Dysgonomonas hofstadii TaxID=637886 RepID=A0A840CNE2_9BACT|nr:hypothetical protein [Dysgonomonas hofstadii]MBB4036916.1 hypothetical protein [Dysgonomonas hofstadii]
MKKTLCTLLFALSVTALLFAQEEKKFLNLGVIPKWSLNKHDTIYRNNISLNLIYGSSINNYGFSFSGLFHETKNMRGVQIGGLLNYVEKKAEGITIAGLYNRVEDSRGLQIAFFNKSTYMTGVQIGGFNHVDIEGSGLQIGFGNFSMDHSSHKVKFNGMQIAVLGNEADTLNGIQIGLYNSARHLRGLQIGLLNISNNNKFPIGLVNIVPKSAGGSMHVGLMYDDLGNLSPTFRSGGKYLYGIATLGYNLKSMNQLYVSGGIGAHIHISDRFRIDTEVTAGMITKVLIQMGNVDDEKVKQKAKEYNYKRMNHYALRILPNIKINKEINFFAGPTLNYITSRSRDNKKLFPSYSLWKDFNDDRMRQLYIGWTAGVQYTL